MTTTTTPTTPTASIVLRFESQSTTTTQNSRKRRRRLRRGKASSRDGGSILWTVLLLGLVFCLVDALYLFYRIHNQGENGDVVVVHESNIDVVDEHNDKGPLVEILRQSGMKEADITKEVVDKLPAWSQVIALIGDYPRIYGLDSCKSFRENVDPAEAFIAPAGAFNSGTNLMAELLIANCVNTHRVKKYGLGNNGVRWQVNWGKHQPPKYRLDHSINEDGKVPNENILPVVMTRDPYSWMQSLCRHRYATHWFHVVPYHCPNLVPNHVEREFLPQAAHYKERYPDLHQNDPWLIDNVKNTANYTLDSKTVPVYVKYKKETINHESLAHMWNDWYRPYFEADFPRIMVRFEDLLFFGKNVTEQACACIGGSLNPRRPFRHIFESAKKGEIHGDDRTSLVDALIRYGTNTDTVKSKGMTRDDLDFARKSLAKDMMDAFGYKTLNPSLVDS